MFKAWEGVFFSEEQCVYLGVWHDNVRNLRSDDQTGLAILGLWRAFCYWLQKTQNPDDMQDIPPSELAWSYIRQTEQWVIANMRRNTVRQTDVLTTIERPAAPTLCSCRRRRATRSAAPTPAFGCGKPGGRAIPTSPSSTPTAIPYSEPRAADAPAYARALASVLSTAESYPVIIVQTTEQRIGDVEGIVRNARPNVRNRRPPPLRNLSHRDQIRFRKLNHTHVAQQVQRVDIALQRDA